MVRRVQRVQMSAAQRSALECSGVLDTSRPGENTPEENVLRWAVLGDGLLVSPTTQATIADVLNDLSNGEDDLARRLGKREPGSFLAARASRSLAALYGKVLRLKFAPVEAQGDSDE